ncbi:hypothetical protein V8C42DRAFT_331659 [Trichoderma barbatum]
MAARPTHQRIRSTRRGFQLASSRRTSALVKRKSDGECHCQAHIDVNGSRADVQFFIFATSAGGTRPTIAKGRKKYEYV